QQPFARPHWRRYRLERTGKHTPQLEHLAVAEVGRSSAVERIERVEQYLFLVRIELLGPHNNSAISLRNSSRNFLIANNVRVLTVPSGVSVATAISLWVRPSK